MLLHWLGLAPAKSNLLGWALEKLCWPHRLLLSGLLAGPLQSTGGAPPCHCSSSVSSMCFADWSMPTPPDSLHLVHTHVRTCTHVHMHAHSLTCTHRIPAPSLCWQKAELGPWIPTDGGAELNIRPWAASEPVQHWEHRHAVDGNSHCLCSFEQPLLLLRSHTTQALFHS